MRTPTLPRRCGLLLLAAALAGAALPAAAASRSTLIAYQAAFRADTADMFSQMPPDQVAKFYALFGDADHEAVLDTLARCHMAALTQYAPELQEEAYKVIEQGGSFQEAKDALDAAIAVEGEAGGERMEAVRQSYQQASEHGRACIAKFVSAHKPAPAEAPQQ